MTIFNRKLFIAGPKEMDSLDVISSYYKNTMNLMQSINSQPKNVYEIVRTNENYPFSKKDV